MKSPKRKCDVCNKNKKEYNNDFVEIKNYWGFFSNKDETYIECIICEDCWDKIQEYIDTLGGKVRKYRYDMLNGDILPYYDKETIRIKNAKHKD